MFCKRSDDVSEWLSTEINFPIFIFQTTSSPPLPTPVNNVIVGVFSFTALSIVVFLIFYCLRKLRKDQSSPYNDNPRIPFRRVLHSSENFLFEYDRHFFFRYTIFYFQWPHETLKIQQLQQPQSPWCPIRFTTTWKVATLSHEVKLKSSFSWHLDSLEKFLKVGSLFVHWIFQR